MKIANLLVKNGAVINYKDDNNTRLLNIAVDTNNLDMVSFLLDKGARVNGKDASGKTPLILAASKGYFDIAKTLLDSGARMHSSDSDGLSAIDYAIKNKDHSMIELLKSRRK